MGQAKAFASVLGCALVCLSAGLEAKEREIVTVSAHASSQGTVGGFRAVGASVGEVDTARVGVFWELFRSVGDWPWYSSTARVLCRIGGGWTLASGWEVFGTVLATPMPSEFLSDSTLGLKWSMQIEPWFFIALDGRVSAPLNLDGDEVWRGVSFGPRLSVELYNDREPGVFRASVGYWFNQQANLLQNPLQTPIAETRAFVLAIDTVDRVDVTVGAEVPFQAGQGWVSPMVEWSLSVPVYRQGEACWVGASGRVCGSEGGSRQSVLLGVRSSWSSLGVVTGLELGVVGAYDMVLGLHRASPYAVLVGVTYAP